MKFRVWFECLRDSCEFSHRLTSHYLHCIDISLNFFSLFLCLEKMHFRLITFRSRSSSFRDNGVYVWNFSLWTRVTVFSRFHPQISSRNFQFLHLIEARTYINSLVAICVAKGFVSDFNFSLLCSCTDKHKFYFTRLFTDGKRWSGDGAEVENLENGFWKIEWKTFQRLRWVSSVLDF